MEEVIEAINLLGKRDWFDILTLVLSILSLIATAIVTVVNIYFVNKNTNRQIANQNKETYKPRLRVNKITNVKGNSVNKYIYAYANNYEPNKDKVKLYVDIELENIGNGLANDISFYTLNNGEPCIVSQNLDEDINQELNSTLEFSKSESKIVKFAFNFNKESLNIKDKVNYNDFLLIICNYKDLNGNNYRLLIGFILKKYIPSKLKELSDGSVEKLDEGYFNIYYYQEDTKDYKVMINLYNTNYQKILDYIKLEDF